MRTMSLDGKCPCELASVHYTTSLSHALTLSRNAVDFGLPLLNNAQCAELFVESLARKISQGGLRSYEEDRIPSEVKSWAEFVGVKA